MGVGGGQGDREGVARNVPVAGTGGALGVVIWLNLRSPIPSLRGWGAAVPRFLGLGKILTLDGDWRSSRA